MTPSEEIIQDINRKKAVAETAISDILKTYIDETNCIIDAVEVSILEAGSRCGKGIIVDVQIKGNVNVQL